MKNSFNPFIFAAAIALSACGDKTTTDDTSGESATDETVHTVTTSDSSMDFTPKDLTIAVGDTVEFIMTATHNAIEVSQETYENIGIDALEGGFAVGYGETQRVTFSEAGTHYYVCQPHVTLDMVGTITVE